MDSELVFHHIGIACRDIDKTREFYLGLGYTASPVVDDPLQHVRICFLDKEGAPRLELLQPLDDQSLRTKRFLLVSGPVPACALGDRRIAFLYNKNNGLIELVENPA